MAPPSEVYELPPVAYDTISDPSVKLELHGISFSHYVERARWALRLLGLPYREVNYLPMAHIPAMVKLQKRFKQGPGKATASSKSPSATPVLALYSEQDKPVCLLQNSTLIMRYAALRAKALNPTSAHLLYGESLQVDSSSNPSAHLITGSDEQYQQVAALESRLSCAMGIEVRRVMYYYLLPRLRLGGQMFTRNSTGRERWFAWPLYFINRLLLPIFLKIDASTAARGQQRLLEEFDFFDQQLLKQQQQQGRAAPTSATVSTEPQKLPYYLCGGSLSAADVSLACLGGYIVGAPYQQYVPAVKELPKELEMFIEALCERPTGKYILDLWRVHGPPQTSKL